MLNILQTRRFFLPFFMPIFITSNSELHWTLTMGNRPLQTQISQQSVAGLLCSNSATKFNTLTTEFVEGVPLIPSLQFNKKPIA